MSGSPELEELVGQFRKTALDGKRVSELLERGQGELPLSRRFGELSEAIGAATVPLPVVVLGLGDAATVDAVLGWLSGRDLRGLTSLLPPVVGLVELHPEGGGDLPGPGATQDVDSLLRELRGGQGGDRDVANGDVLQLRFSPTESSVHSSTLAFRSPAALLANPQLRNRVSRRGGVVVVAAPRSHQFSPADEVAIWELASTLDLCLPVVLDGPPGQNAPGWWSAGAASAFTALCPPVLLSRDPPALPDVLRSSDHPMQRLAFLSLESQRLLSVAELVDDQHGQRVTRLVSRRGRMERRARDIERRLRSQDVRPDVDALREIVDQGLSGILERIGEENRKATLPAGELTRKMLDVVELLEPDDLQRTRTTKKFRLSVSEDFLQRVSRTLEEAVAERLSTDLGHMDSGMEETLEKLGAALSDFTGEPHSVSWDAPDEKEILSILREMINVEIRYRGELDRKGFWARLSEGRRFAFVILMTVSLFGGAFKFSRRATPVAVLILVLFFYGVGKTYISWTNEEKDRLDKELERVKDSLRNEVKQHFSSIHREKFNRLSTALAEFKKESLKRIDAAARATLKDQAERGERERAEIHSRIQGVDQRLRSVQQHASSIAEMIRGCRQLADECRKLLRQETRHVTAAQT